MLASPTPYSFRINQLAPYDLDFLGSIDSKPNLLRAHANHRHHDRVADLNPLASAPRKYQHSPPPCRLENPIQQKPNRAATIYARC
jgi:hypothetical protein